MSSMEYARQRKMIAPMPAASIWVTWMRREKTGELIAHRRNFDADALFVLAIHARQLQARNEDNFARSYFPLLIFCFFAIREGVTCAKRRSKYSKPLFAAEGARHTPR
ncbi:hypothetical protein [Variovorax boronicumulans]|uniref:hypothetical protein n=1 Tax=Variovorax boronicumulans TaxID=436515 RepID=UPI0015871498|nr:hypothetical protein [Variovorax boronicumulans]